MISYALWLNRFHRDPHIAGATITLDRRNYRIIGVMPRSFEFPLLPGRVGQAQLWVPMSFTAAAADLDRYCLAPTEKSKDDSNVLTPLW